MKDIICWWSGGVTSAVACQMAIDIYGLECCRIIFIDTKNEHDDTYRFLKDCENWYGKKIETITAIGRDKKYGCIQDVWHDYESLNVARGAICSSELKRAVRLNFQRKNSYRHQVFGFDIDEPKRAKNMRKNYKVARPIYPLLMFGYTKKHCLAMLKSCGIEVPEAYKLGFTNNNCLKTGCVQGGVGYWKKMQEEFPVIFEEMAKQEHKLTGLKGKPVTCLRDQSKAAKASGFFQVFLKPHPDYPDHKSIDQMKGRPVENLMECNGFCGTSDQLLT